MENPARESMSESFVSLSVLIYREHRNDPWIAQCLEYDICVQAPTLEEAHKSFERALAANALVSVDLGRQPFEGIDRAPQQFWDWFEQAKVHTRMEPAPMRLPKPTPMPEVRPRFRVLELLQAAE